MNNNNSQELALRAALYDKIGAVQAECSQLPLPNNRGSKGEQFYDKDTVVGTVVKKCRENGLSITATISHCSPLTPAAEVTINNTKTPTEQVTVEVYVTIVDLETGYQTILTHQHTGKDTTMGKVSSKTRSEALNIAYQTIFQFAPPSPTTTTEKRTNKIQPLTGVTPPTNMPESILQFIVSGKSNIEITETQKTKIMFIWGNMGGDTNTNQTLISEIQEIVKGVKVTPQYLMQINGMIAFKQHRAYCEMLFPHKPKQKAKGMDQLAIDNGFSILRQQINGNPTLAQVKQQFTEHCNNYIMDILDYFTMLGALYVRVAHFNAHETTQK